MNPLGRNLSILSIISRLPLFFLMFVRSIKYFKSPWQLWIAYVRAKKPPNNSYELRNGMRIHLSDNDHDSITVMVIFCRKEYGSIISDSSIVDIGANIGVFTIYAIYHGASKIAAIEPSLGSFRILSKNIKANQLEDKVKLYNNAVWSSDNVNMSILDSSSPYNRLDKLDGLESSEVASISVSTLLTDFNHLGKVDLVKIDCEGAEYEILYNLDLDSYRLLGNIRIEHHETSKKDELIRFLNNKGYEVEHDTNMILWFRGRE